MASTPSAVLLIACSLFAPLAAQEEELPTMRVRVLAAGQGKHGFGPESLGLGKALPREQAVQRIGPGALRTPGGVELRWEAAGMRMTVPGVPPLVLDAFGRILQDGKALTGKEPHGVAMRFLDGSELRVRPGSDPRHLRVELVEADAAHTLVLRGRRDGRRRRAESFTGRYFYWTDRGIVEISRFGPWFVVRPRIVLRGGERDVRVLFAADLWREANFALAGKMPARSAQFPLSRKHVLLVARATEGIFPRGEARDATHRKVARQPFVLPIGGDLRVSLEVGPGNLDFVTRLALHPDAPETLELLHAWRRETLHRVLPPDRQARGRFVGTGLDFDAFAQARLPWKGKLDNALQRREALAILRDHLPKPARRD